MTTRHYISEWADTDVLWIFEGEIQHWSKMATPPEVGQIAIEFARDGWRQKFVVESVECCKDGYFAAYLRRPHEYE